MTLNVGVVAMNDRKPNHESKKIRWWQASSQQPLAFLSLNPCTHTHTSCFPCEGCWTNYLPLCSGYRIARSATACLWTSCSVLFGQCYLRYYKYRDCSNLRHSHCLSVACILSCCCCPLIPPRGSCSDSLFPTHSCGSI